MALSPSTKLGRYEVRSQIGAGGMGEVYFARDTRLGRPVALKLLASDLTKSKDRLHRFEQEARATSALNHPNILTIYEIGQEGTTCYIATEFIDGVTLRQKMAQNSMKIIEALNVAVQVAEALVAAHAVGIVHRDIKPENIMLRPDGYVKVLDFGLAKLTENLHRQFVDPEASTATNFETDPGVMIGTVAYMSPEQVRGQKTDGRTDIWSLGVTLFEMIAGRAPFEGSTKSDNIVSILEKEPPPLARYATSVPTELQRIVTKTLRKDREERYQTAKDLLIDLKNLKEQLDFESRSERSIRTGASSDVSNTIIDEQSATRAVEKLRHTDKAETARRTSSVENFASELRRHKIGALVLLMALMGAGLAYWMSTPSKLPIEFIPLMTTSNARDVAISPDGKYVAMVLEDSGKQSLWLRQVATPSSTPIVAPSESQYRGLTFSHDGSYIYYLKQEGGAETVYQKPLLGGAPRKLLTNVNTLVTLSPDDKQLAFIRKKERAKVLMIANVDGTRERELATSPPSFDFDTSVDSNNGPAWSPDGKVIACPVTSSTEPLHMNVAAVQVNDGSVKLLSSQQWFLIGQLAWLSDSSYLVMNAQDRASSSSSYQIWLISYPGGKARRVTQDLDYYSAVSVTKDSGLLLTMKSEDSYSIWFASNKDLSRSEQIISSRTKGSGGISWTPDGKIIYASNESGNQDIWIMEANGSNPKQLTFDEHDDVEPVSSPDGRYIVFVSYRTGAHIWRMDADGTHLKQLTNGNYEDWPSFSPDGQWIIYHEEDSSTHSVRKVSIEGGDPVLLTDKPSTQPVISPDGKQIACFSQDEQANSPWRITVIPFGEKHPFKVFDVPPSVGQQWHGMRWTPDGKALTYINTQGGISNLWSQPLSGGPAKQLTNFKEGQIYAFAWSPNGQQLACVRGVVTNDIVLVKNFK